MRKVISFFLLPLLLLLVLSHKIFALPIVAQTGNLILNGNFETAAISPWLPNDNPTVSIMGDYKIDGEYSAFIDTTTGTTDHAGEWRVGLWQYPGLESNQGLPDDFYTVSAWVFPIQGQAYLGLAYGGGGFQHFSKPTSVLNEWQYLELTEYKASYYSWTLGGPVLFGLSNQDKFYVDGVWFNQGTVNTSPYAPVPVPEPSTLVMTGLSLFIALRYRKKVKTKQNF